MIRRLDELIWPFRQEKGRERFLSFVKTLDILINHHNGTYFSLFLDFFFKHIFDQQNVKKNPVGECAPYLALESFPILN